jgi:hypothetical protein
MQNVHAVNMVGFHDRLHSLVVNGVMFKGYHGDPGSLGYQAQEDRG